MQWTAELDALLNQCVFECGYDFTSAAALLVSRARQLRLVSGDERIVVASDECQVRWMEINPVVEEDEDDGGGDRDDGTGENSAFFRHSFHDDDFHFYLPQTDSPLTTGVETAGRAEVVEAAERHNEIRPVERTLEEVTEPSTGVDIPEGCPRLELSLSDADLDALLNSLPNAGADDSQEDAAGSKRERRADGAGSSSEMQWVLSFLSNPEEAAHHDAEAKNMLFETGDRSEDDNFQYFLQQLSHANLTSPDKPVNNHTTATAADASDSRGGGDLDTTSDEGEDSGEDWTEARKQIKTTGPIRESVPKTEPKKIGHSPGHKRRLDPKASHMDEVLPPAAPLRFPPRIEALDAFNTDDGNKEDLDDNGLDALQRYEPPPSASLPLRMPPPDFIRPAAPSSSKLLALSHEIGQQLRKNGEFQFPKQLFRDIDTAANIDDDHVQVPEDDP